MAFLSSSSLGRNFVAMLYAMIDFQLSFVDALNDRWYLQECEERLAWLLRDFLPSSPSPVLAETAPPTVQSEQEVKEEWFEDFFDGFPTMLDFSEGSAAAQSSSVNHRRPSPVASVVAPPLVANPGVAPPVGHPPVAPPPIAPLVGGSPAFPPVGATSIAPLISGSPVFPPAVARAEPGRLYYVVTKGLNPGTYDTWEGSDASTNGVCGSCHKGHFKSHAAAEEYYVGALCSGNVHRTDRASRVIN